MSNLIRVAAKRNQLLLLTSGLAMVLAMAFIAAAGQLAQAAPQGQQIDPSNFVDKDGKPFKIDNKFFPLNPGTTFFYEGTEAGVPTSNKVVVTDKTKTILGVTTTVVHDQVFNENKKLVEDTYDWYAQDKDGNVWYFGEDTKELDPNTGQVTSTEGSWEAGVDGAQPGIIMEANPQVGDRYYQELYKGVAEDQAQVLSLTESKCVSYGCFNNLLLTKEWTRLEPGVVDNKYYAPGVGFILEEMVKGGDERSELVKITTGG